MESITILGTHVDSCNMAEAVEEALAIVDGGKGGVVVTPNAEMLWRAHKDSEFRLCLNSATMSLPDGVGVCAGARLLGSRVSRVAGVDFGACLAYAAGARGRSLYLLGGKEGVAKDAADVLTHACPGLRVCGTRNGYFNIDSSESDDVIEEIRRASPDIVYVCLGSPRQEMWVRNNIESLPPALYVCLGGSLDVYAGRVRRAPELVRRAGLEWAWRVASEPHRLRRASALPRYAFAVAKDALFGKKAVNVPSGRGI